ncbi:MAG: hypothetical protein JO212_12945 [Acetobacteraceae bacterium]|nr:hypothetical protein [Acetobacteraceae bacterium]
MGYEIRSNGQDLGMFDRSEDALDRVRAILKRDPDCEPEVVDTHTGQAFMPGATVDWRDELASKIG